MKTGKCQSSQGSSAMSNTTLTLSRVTSCFTLTHNLFFYGVCRKCFLVLYQNSTNSPGRLIWSWISSWYGILHGKQISCFTLYTGQRCVPLYALYNSRVQVWVAEPITVLSAFSDWFKTLNGSSATGWEHPQQDSCRNLTEWGRLHFLTSCFAFLRCASGAIWISLLVSCVLYKPWREDQQGDVSILLLARTCKKNPAQSKRLYPSINRHPTQGYEKLGVYPRGLGVQGRGYSGQGINPSQGTHWHTTDNLEPWAYLDWGRKH